MSSVEIGFVSAVEAPARCDRILSVSLVSNDSGGRAVL